MENLDLSKLLIQDSEYYNPSATYNGLLKDKNIYTVEQLLTEYQDNNSSFFKGYSSMSMFELTGFISMLEYKYQGKPLLYDYLLDERIDFNKSNYGVIYLATSDESNNDIYLDELFGCPRDSVTPVFVEFKKLVKHQFMYKQFDLPEENNAKVIDFLKWALPIDNDKFKHIIPFIRTYVANYEQQHQLVSGENESIEFLKGQLTSIMKTKESLDIQIANLQQQIETLSNTENKGGIKR